MPKDDRKARILERAEREKVKFMRLQFTDILGATKNVEVPDRQIDEALDGTHHVRRLVDRGLRPHRRVRHVPQAGSQYVPGVSVELRGLGACRPHHLRHRQSRWQPRSPAAHGQRLKRAIALAAEKGFAMQAGPEAEFFLFQRRSTGEPTTETHDSGGYFDLTPVDLGEDVRREIIVALEQMGFHVEAAHHEVAPGQHEIDFRYDDALTTADNVGTFRFVVKNVANRNGLHATFMPKPIFGINGSGMHTHQSLYAGNKNRVLRCGRPVAAQPHVPSLHRRPSASRETLLRDHQPARELAQAARPRLRSADRHRLVGTQSQPARSRAGRARRTRRVSNCGCRILRAIRISRSPQCCRAGLDGIDKQMDPGPPVNKNIYKMSHRERRHLRIDELPSNLSEALDELEKSALMRDALGDHIFDHFIAAKRPEWDSYIRHVSPWEIDRY